MNAKELILYLKKIHTESLNILKIPHFKQIPINIDNKFRESFNLNNKEQILLWNDTGTVFSAKQWIITEKGLYFFIGKNNISINWFELNSVEFNSDNYYFYYNKEKSKFETFSKTFIVSFAKSHSSYNIKFAEMLSSIAINFDHDEINLFNEIKSNFENQDFENSLLISNKYLENFGNEMPRYYNTIYYRAEAFFYLQNYDASLKEIEILIKNKNKYSISGEDLKIKILNNKKEHLQNSDNLDTNNNIDDVYKNLIISELSKNKSFLEEIGNCFFYNTLSKQKIIDIKKEHEFNLFDDILFLHETSFYAVKSSITFTSKQLSIFKENKNKSFLRKINISGKDKATVFDWKEIETVEFIDNFFLIFTDKKNNIFTSVESNIFIGYNNEKLGQKYAEMLTKIAKYFDNTEKTESEKISSICLELENSIYDNKKQEFSELINLTNEFTDKHGNNSQYDFVVRYARAFIEYKKQNYKTAQIEIDNSLENEQKPFQLKLKAKILEGKKEFYSSLQILNSALEKAENLNIKDKIKHELQTIYEGFTSEFKDIDYLKRKIILIGDTISCLDTTTFNILLKDKLPELNFPLGHPVCNNFYIGHPYNPSIYYPLKGHEEEFFKDKIDEFKLFLQCLGAKEITITIKKGNNIFASQEKDINANIGGSAKGIGAKIKFDKNKKNEKLDKLNNSRAITQKFAPTKKPYLPNGLAWYKSETNWQRLYQQRLNGSILEHTEKITSSNLRKVTSDEVTRISAELSKLPTIPVDIKAGFELNKKNMTQELKTSEIEVKVIFAHLNELTEEANQVKQTQLETSKKNEIPEGEQRYIKDLKFCIEDDGRIDEDERRKLTRKIKKYNISKERAKELETEILSSQFTKQELEYIEEIEECLSDGDVSEGDRRLLVRLASQNNISNERAVELENFVLQNSN